MHNPIAVYIINLLNQLSGLNGTVILLIILLVIVVIVLDSLNSHSSKKKQDTGIGPKAAILSVDGTKSIPAKSYLSEAQGLAGRPDALIIENGYVIPVERKPLARKLRDRYIAQLLVYMRLVEEFEGKKPPYGYLILGPSCRKVKITNSPERQDWLSRMIYEMNAVLEERACLLAEPHVKKCEKCDVREYCNKKISRQNNRETCKNSYILSQRVN